MAVKGIDPEAADRHGILVTEARCPWAAYREPVDRFACAGVMPVLSVLLLSERSPRRLLLLLLVELRTKEAACLRGDHVEEACLLYWWFV